MFGIMVGSFSSGMFISRGRRTAIIWMIFLSWVGFALSMILNINCILVGRFVIGFAAGVSNGCASKSINECVNKKMSGQFGTVPNLAICLGSLVCFSFGMAMPDNKENYDQDQFWRSAFIFGIVYTILQLVIFYTVFKYEPIDFLIKKGEKEDAKKQVELLYKKNHSIDGMRNDEVIQLFCSTRYNELMLDDAASVNVGYGKAMCDPKFSRATWTAVGVGMTVHLTAIAPVIMFSTTLLILMKERSNGEFPIDANLGTLIMGVSNFVGAIVSIWAFKYMGRRTNLLVGFGCLTVVNLLIGIFMKMKAFTAIYVMILIFVFVFQIHVGAMSFLYAAEVCVDTAQGIALAALFFVIVCITGSMQYMIDGPFGMSGTFWFYAGLNLLCAVYTYLCVKETMNKTPYELKTLFWTDDMKKKFESLM